MCSTVLDIVAAHHTIFSLRCALVLALTSYSSLLVPAGGQPADRQTGEAADGETNAAAGVTISETCDVMLEPWVVETLRQGMATPPEAVVAK